MNIRLNNENEINRLVDIWYEGSLIAHEFIDIDYWKTQRTEMRERYLPMSETYVICTGKHVVGFVSMVDNYLAALFIDVNHQGEGYGERLLSFIKERRESIQLKVYKKNNKAVNFYLKNDFVIDGNSLDERTAEKEFLMKWEKD